MASDKKVIVITGASSGIGEASAKLLAQNGHQVVLAARRQDKLKAITQEITEGGNKASYQICDVSKREDVDQLINQTWEQFGRIDVLVNNAGIMPLSLMKNGRVEEWDQMIDINIKGVLYGIAAVMPKFEAQGSGHIINMSSTAAHRLFTGGGVYCGTKAALKMISYALRMELDPKKKIRVTQIEPGAVTTELPMAIKDEEFKAQNDWNVERLLDPEDIARSVNYAVEQPPHVNVDVVTVIPQEQSW